MSFTHLNCRRVPEKSYVFSLPANLGCDLWRGKKGKTLSAQMVLTHGCIPGLSKCNGEN